MDELTAAWTGRVGVEDGKGADSKPLPYQSFLPRKPEPHDNCNGYTCLTQHIAATLASTSAASSRGKGREMMTTNEDYFETTRRLPLSLHLNTS